MNVNPFNTRLWIRLMSLALIVVVALAACAPAATPTPAGPRSTRRVGT